MNFLRKYGWLAAIFAVLLGAVFFMGPGREMAAGTDITSEEIMIGDMIYDRQNPQDPARILLQRYVSPLTEHSLGRKYVTDVYAQDGTLPSEDFETYDSQPGLAGIVYGLADRLLPFSPQTRLDVLHGVNGVLYCLMLTVILGWAARWFGKGAMVLSAVCAAAIMPHTFSFATNLYWLGWVQMLPMAVMCFTLRRGLPARHCGLRLFLSAFIPCLIRFLCQYEYVSDVCICLMVPVLVQLWAEPDGARRFWRTAVPPTVGALAAFGASVVYKLCVLARLDGGFAAAWKRFMEPVAVRLFGKASEAYEYSQEASQASLPETFRRVLKTPLYEVVGIRVQLWHFLALAAMALLLVAVLWALRRGTQSRGAQLSFAFLSFLAAASWLVLAKPHSYVHVGWAQATFFMPFLLCLPAYWILAAGDLLRFFGESRHSA